jgi:hypothetical protein
LFCIAQPVDVPWAITGPDALCMPEMWVCITLGDGDSMILIVDKGKWRDESHCMTNDDDKDN